MLRFVLQLRLTDTMKESEYIRLVIPLRDRLFRFAQSLLLSPSEAEDVVHDLLARLWRDREGMELPRKVDAFLLTALRNGCYDRLRQRQAEARRREAVKVTAERATDAGVGQWEVRELVRRAMAALPERQREVLHLKEIEGYPTHEIAGMIGCGEAQVRVILSRARMGLRGILQKMRSDERTTRTD